MAQQQRAVVVTTTDEAQAKTFDNLELREQDKPRTEEGQVLVRIMLRPVNPTDVLQSAGGYGHKAPFVPGSEGVGVVDELGPGTSGRLSKGQRVVSADWGLASWQEYAAVDEKLLVLEALRPGGAVTVFGSLSGPGLDIQVSQLFGKSVNSFIIYQWLPSHGPEKARALFDDAFKLFPDVVLSAHPGKRYPFAEFKKALETSVAPGRSAESPKVFLES